MSGVDAAVVTEIPSDDGESTIGLEVRGSVSAEDARQWCIANLSAYKRPAVIRIL
jgi:hypothetical protein